MKRQAKTTAVIAALITAAVFSSAVYAEDQPEKTYDNIEICTVELPSAKSAPVNGSYDTLLDAEDAAGFYFDGSYSNPEGLPFAEYSVTDGVLQIRYYNTNGDERVVRMAEGSADISSDDTDYLAVTADRIKDADVSLRGTSCGYYLASWTKGGYTFSVKSNYPMSAEEMENTVGEIILG